jgi:SAM-dependent methyltransferase
MGGYAERMYARYSQMRPHCAPPASAEDLLASRAPVFHRFFAPFLPTHKDASILDLGCGYGEFLYFLQAQGYVETMGIDLNAEQLEIARALGVRNVHCGQGADFLRRSVRQFDFISAIDILEHVPKDRILQFLNLIHEALRRGGRFLCQVPNVAAFYTPLFYMDFSHETPFTATSLNQILKLADFANVRVFAMGPVAHGVKSAIRFVLWKAIAAGLRFIQTVEGGPRDSLSSIYSATILGVAERP